MENENNTLLKDRKYILRIFTILFHTTFNFCQFTYKISELFAPKII